MPTRDEILGLAEAIYVSGVRLIDSIPDAWWEDTAWDSNGGPQTIRLDVRGINAYASWRLHGEPAANDRPHDLPTDFDWALMVADTMADGVYVLAEHAPKLWRTPFDDPQAQVEALASATNYKKARGRAFGGGHL